MLLLDKVIVIPFQSDSNKRQSCIVAPFSFFLRTKKIKRHVVPVFFIIVNSALPKNHLEERYGYATGVT